MVSARLYSVEIGHVRAAPMRHEVRHRGYQWYVDLDDLPRLPALLRPFARFRSADHLGDPDRTLRANVEAYLADNGIDLDGGSITMLANARVLGYVFNPLSLFWCHDRTGQLVCVIAEVHNTYGQRHRYLLRPDDAGRAEAEKQFYVSPFHPVDGYYRMSVPEPGERLAITVTLHRPDCPPFTASVRGVGAPATTRAVLSAALRHPLETWVTRLLIVKHGITLWARGLPVQPRPPHPSFQPEPEPPMPRTPHTAAQRLADLVHDIAGVDLPIRLRAWDGSEAGPADGPVLVVASRRALRRLVWAPGELGLARAYVSGDIEVEGDLTDGFRRVWQLARTRPTTAIQLGLRARASALGPAARLGALGPPPAPPAVEARLTGRRHTRGRDRAAIAHHYDLSNDFYESLLDETMAYSSAYFTSPEQSPVNAQRAKLELICRKLDLQPGQQLLDVGCGWGSLITYAAAEHGVHATGITLSAQQRDHVVKRVADLGLADRVEVRLQDYRDLAATGQTFDAVSSIEMGEHVGEEHYPVYAATLLGSLRPGARLLLQQMSRHHGTAPGGGAFIESYIAPDMHMRPLSQTIAHLERAGFEIRDVEALREHYVTTVRCWLDTLEHDWAHFVALVGEPTARVWRLYLAGGALSFEEGRMGVDQVLARRPA
jgi:cyclopropane fatty-acyl-phospholipid synthase-like methyltransferase/DUF1365 family protein